MINEEPKYIDLYKELGDGVTEEQIAITEKFMRRNRLRKKRVVDITDQFTPEEVVDVTITEDSRCVQHCITGKVESLKNIDKIERTIVNRFYIGRTDVMPYVRKFTRQIYRVAEWRFIIFSLFTRRHK